LKLLIAFCLFLLNFFTLSTHDFRGDSAKKTFRFQTIIIDPGHGGKDPGAHGSYYLEKNIALSIGKKLKTSIEKSMPDIRVIMTRTTDRFIELNKRSAIANQNHANLFISIHCNSSPEGAASAVRKKAGAMVLVYGFHRKQEQAEAIRENSSIYQEKNYQKNYKGFGGADPSNAIMVNAFLQKYRKQSIQFAEFLIREFKNHDKRLVIGVKEQGVLVLAHSAMPAVLVETGFINNPIEERYLNSSSGQQEIVQSIIRSISRYRSKISN
jgi:N-acetylmuramoyl-L-alanine amidase